MKWYREVFKATQCLVETPSISPHDDDSDARQRCPDLIAQLLCTPFASGESPDFQLELLPISAEDPRRNVFCLLRGAASNASQNTIILLGHYDTVGVDNFSDSELAFSSEKMRQYILQKAAPEGHSRLGDAQKDARELFEINGEVYPAWNFGRGVLDMKSGIAISIEVLRQLWQERQNLRGNILLVASPDEESDSAGMLAAVTALLQWRERENLNYMGAINVDYTTARSESSNERYIYTGTIGKLLPTFYVVGEQTHVGEPFRGVDANLIVSEIIRAVSLDSSLCDVWSDGNGKREVCVPPIVLNSRDLKMLYNVQTSAEAFVFVNWLTYTLSPEQALKRLKAKAAQALHNALAHVYHQHQQFQSIGGMEAHNRSLDSLAPHVYSYDDLRSMWMAQHKASAEDFSKWVQTQLEALEGDYGSILQQLGEDHRHQLQEWGLLYSVKENGLDDREKTGILVKKLVQDLEAVQHPAVVIYFSPPFYPHHAPSQHPLSSAMQSVLDNLSLDTGETISVLGFYPYISDMSFLQIAPNIAQELQNIPITASENFSLSQSKIAEIAQLNCPTINIGAYGKEAHGQYERVYTPYSYETVPEIIYQTIHETFKHLS